MSEARTISAGELAKRILLDWQFRLGGRWTELAEADKQQLAELAADEAWIALRAAVAFTQEDQQAVTRDRQHVKAQFATILAMHVDVAASTLNDTLRTIIGGALKILIAAI